MKFLRLALTMAAGAVLACVPLEAGTLAGAASTPTTTGGCSQAVTVKSSTHGIGGVQPTKPTASSSPAVACAAASPATNSSSDYSGDPPILYEGGPVLDTDGALTLTPVFWAPSGYSFPAAYLALLERYVDDVAHDSGLSTNVFGDTQQYYENENGQDAHIKYAISSGAPITDNDPYPTSGGCAPDTGAVYSDNTTYTACVTDSQLQAELNALNLPETVDHIYLLYLPEGVESCFDTANNAAGGTCTTASALKLGSYCGYHGFVLNGTSSLFYAALPYPVVQSATGYGCNTNEVSPNKNLEADTMISITGHEANEAISDPELSAWFDAVGNEIADDCAYIYGANEGGAGNTAWNQVINGDHYYTQEMFSNEAYTTKQTTACIQKRALPTAAITALPAETQAGNTISFSGSRSKDTYTTNGITTYSWNFGDGTTASGTSAKHAYATPGKYTVTLTVTDADGWHGTATKAITVNKKVTL